MKTMTYSYARQNLADTMDHVCQDHDPVVVTSKNSKAVVIMSLDDYESMNESAYLLRSPKNANRLLASIKQISAGKGKEKKI